MQAITHSMNKNFRNFLRNCGFQVRISNPHNWNSEAICDVMMVALRSETDVLSGSYPSIEAFLAHIRELKIVDDPVPSRGNVMSNEDWDQIVAYYSNINQPFPYEMTTPRGSRNLYWYAMFLEKHGFSSCEGYLETRGWFCRSSELQRMTLEVVLQGKGELINVLAPDYREHITSLLKCFRNMQKSFFNK